MIEFTPDVLSQLQRFSAIIDVLGKDVSASDYDKYKDTTKPSRRNLERKTGLTWNDLKSISKDKIKNQEQGNKIRFLNIVRSRGVIKLDDLCDLFGCDKNKISDLVSYYQQNGNEIYISGNNVIYSKDKIQDVPQILRLADKEIILGIASDLHFGSHSCQITALKEFVVLCKKMGVKNILVPGDVFAGYGVYSGQVHDLYAISEEDQLQSCRVNLPLENDLEWIMMGGNHDYSFIKYNGTNIVKTLSKYRKDVKYVGYDLVTVPILNNVDAILWHPSGGVPYSYSYRLQKGIEQIALDELNKTVRGVQDKPKIRFVFAGHLHIQMQALFGSIFGAQCGCFEGQTNYLKRKGLVPAIGGWIIKATLGASGLLRNFEAKFYVMEEIENDYKNYNHTINEEEDKEPISSEDV